MQQQPPIASNSVLKGLSRDTYKTRTNQIADPVSLYICSHIHIKKRHVSYKLRKSGIVEAVPGKSFDDVEQPCKET
jgi:hypothetical protein